MEESDLKMIRAFERRREGLRQEKLDRLYRQASEDAKAIIQMIVADFKPKRMYQWGSLLDRDRFSEISDIDIAVEGIQGAEEFFSMLGKAQALTSFSLDLVEVDKIMGEFAEQIRKYGRIVYEQEST